MSVFLSSRKDFLLKKQRVLLSYLLLFFLAKLDQPEDDDEDEDDEDAAPVDPVEGESEEEVSRACNVWSCNAETRSWFLNLTRNQEEEEDEEE